MLTWHPIKIKLADLKPFDRNPRTITASKFESLKKSLDDLGEFKPLVVDFDKQTILAGNQRFRAMLEKYNLDHEVDCFVPDRELTEAEREKVVVVENGHFGEWDYDLLSGFSIDIGELDLDISIPEIELPEDTIEDQPVIEDKKDFIIYVECTDELQQNDLFEEFNIREIKCKII
jgi:site-specific DNA-methyltransferase (adenine-specific)